MRQIPRSKLRGLWIQIIPIHIKKVRADCRYSRSMWTALLLTISNIFMTVAWYGHLKFAKTALWVVVLVSWGIAFLEYCFQVPANRIGHQSGYSAAQLKVMQEVITLIVFAGFSITYLGEKLTWNYYVGFGLVLAAVFFVYHKW